MKRIIDLTTSHPQTKEEDSKQIYLNRGQSLNKSDRNNTTESQIDKQCKILSHSSHPTEIS